MVNASYAICGLLINILLIVLFYSKKNINNNETKDYSKLIIFGLFQNFLDVVGLILLENGLNGLLSELLIKADYVLILIWALFFTIYMIEITNINELIKKVLITFLQVVTCIGSVLLIILPVYVVNSNNVNNSYGPSTNMLSIICGMFIILIIVSYFSSIIKNKKNAFNKKVIPLYSLIILLILTMVIRQLHSEIVFQPFIFAFVNIIMYFTIENPDLKMLKQMEMAKEAAEKANRAKSDFLSSMSHEIRTPLNAIVGLSEDIATYQGQVPDEVVEDSNDIRNASHTLLEIVGNILDINKIDSGKMEIVDSKYNFKEEVESLCRVTITRIGEKNINFRLSIAEDIPYELIGDKGKVKEIINNLLTNSIKYTDEGNINLTIKCINDQTQNICNLVITCQDTGRGIKPELINRLFTRFDRLDVERNTTTEGTGLGLAITKSLVEMMGGRINVQSQYGKGSIFVINIPQKIAEIEMPLTNTQALNLQSIREQISQDLIGKKVLIVDDNKLNIKVARKAIADFQFEIDECYDGEECLDKINQGNKYDLILMDIMMPNMSGETCISKLKEMNDFNTPVIALTADALAGAKEKYMSEGFVDYIAKPFSKDQIKEKLDIIFKINS